MARTRKRTTYGVAVSHNAPLGSAYPATRPTRSHWWRLTHLRSWCAYCHAPPPPGGLLTKDHVRPRSAGGQNLADNIVPACFTCNQQKADTPLLQFLLSRLGDTLQP